MFEDDLYHLQFETDLAWTTPLDGIDYVREFVTITRTRTRPIRRLDGRNGLLVGYTSVGDAPSGERGFHRRVFYLAPHDRNADPANHTYRTGAPCEAVDPRTVGVGIQGRLTQRAWGRPWNDQDGGSRAPRGPQIGPCAVCGATLSQSEAVLMFPGAAGIVVPRNLDPDLVVVHSSCEIWPDVPVPWLSASDADIDPQGARSWLSSRRWMTPGLLARALTLGLS